MMHGARTPNDERTECGASSAAGQLPLRAAEQEDDMPATDYLIMNAAKYPDEIALVEVNPAIRDERGKTWRDFELVETPPSQR